MSSTSGDLISVGCHFDRFDGTLDVDTDGTPHIVLTIDAEVSVDSRSGRSPSARLPALLS